MISAPTQIAQGGLCSPCVPEPLLFTEVPDESPTVDCLIGFLSDCDVPTHRRGERAFGAGRPKSNIGAFATEVIRLQVQNKQMDMSMWFPTEFFVEAGLSQGTVTREALEKELGYVRKYAIVAAQRQDVAADGTVTFSSEQDVREAARLVLPDGTELKPTETIPPKVQQLAAAMKNGMAHSAGAGATEHLILVIFSLPENTTIDVESKTKLTLKLKSVGDFKASEATWHMPFDALTPPHACPNCHEMVSQKWSFCPFCGQKSEAPAKKIQKLAPKDDGQL